MQALHLDMEGVDKTEYKENSDAQDDSYMFEIWFAMKSIVYADVFTGGSNTTGTELETFFKYDNQYQCLRRSPILLPILSLAHALLLLRALVDVINNVFPLLSCFYSIIAEFIRFLNHQHANNITWDGLTHCWESELREPALQDLTGFPDFTAQYVLESHRLSSIPPVLVGTVLQYIQKFMHCLPTPERNRQKLIFGINAPTTTENSEWNIHSSFFSSSVLLRVSGCGMVCTMGPVHYFWMNMLKW